MAEFNYPNGDLLVSAAWFAQHLHDPNMKIIDARSAQDYTTGHIPGAVLLPNGAFRTVQGDLLAQRAQLPQSWASWKWITWKSGGRHTSTGMVRAGGARGLLDLFEQRAGLDGVR